MMAALREDAKRRPELFDWEGPVSRAHLEPLLAERGWSLPADLVSLWEQTGGGEIFESETLLAPCGDIALGDNLFTFNDELRQQGLPEGYVVFHSGMTVSAVRLADGRYIELDVTDFHERAIFSSLEDWYLRLIRAEYAERYGLPEAISSS